MKTKHVAAVALALLVIMGLAYWLGRQGGGGGTGESSNPQAGVAEGAGDKFDSPMSAGEEMAPGNVGGEVAPAVREPVATATAQIVRGDGSRMDVRSIDREFERLAVETNEVLTIRIALNDVDPRRTILVEADNGGSLNRRVGPLALQPSTDDGAIEFQYAVGGDKGKYTLFVSQGDRQELMSFYAGREPSTGQSGPPRTFKPEYP